jgi:membrane peptidoglycan carboxypeptidase
MDRVMRRSDRILRRMVAARMISREEYDAAISEVPNLEGLARKVEKTLETPPPEEVPPEEIPAEEIPAEEIPPEEEPPEETPGGGPLVIESPPAAETPEPGTPPVR